LDQETVMSGSHTFRSVVATCLSLLVSAASSHAAGGGPVSALAIDPQAPTTVYAGLCDGNGVQKNVDGGATWNAIGLAGASVYFIAVDPVTPSTLYASAGGWNCAGAWVGTAEAGVYKSTDGGANWSIAGLTGVYVNALAIDPRSLTVLYAAVEGYGVFRSADGGATWAATGQGPLWTESLAIDPVSPDTIYAGNRFMGDESPSFGGVFKSIDGGQTWNLTGLSMGDFRVLVIDPQVPGTVYAGGIWDTSYFTAVNGVFKSTDEGETWTAVGPDGYPVALALDPSRPAVVYSGTFSGLYQSTDGAGSWMPNTALTDLLTRYGTTPWLTTLATEPASSTAASDQPSSIYVATPVGVVKSTDGGASWTPTGLFQRSLLSSVSLDPTEVPAGAVASGTVTLVRAAAADVTVSLTSSEPSVASVPATVTVPAGAMSANFTVTTYPVIGARALSISTTLDDASRSAVLTVIPIPTLSTLLLNPSNVVGGALSNGTATLNMPAPLPGAVVSLATTNSALAAVPSNVTVPAGATTTTFAVSTTPDASGTVTISGTYGGRTASATLTIVPVPRLASITLSSGTTITGNATTGAVTLNQPAASDGAVVVSFAKNDSAPSWVT
jgi:hypothetical protein